MNDGHNSGAYGNISKKEVSVIREMKVISVMSEM